MKSTTVTIVVCMFVLAGSVHGTDYEQIMKAVGENVYDYFGVSVASAGDVNGDGYDDVIVGADWYDNGSSHDAGAAYIFFGGPSMDSIYDVKLVGENSEDHFGISVASAGDVNGDGYNDVVVGAWKYGSDDAGAAYIFFGGPSMDSIYDVKMAGERGDDLFGYSVSSAGDVNGDGYDDIFVGAQRYDNGSNTNSGAAYIFFGGPSMDSIYDIKMVGEYHHDYFGYSVSSAGDVNEDGYDDVVVGAKFYPQGDAETGAAYIFFGGPSMDSIYDVKMVGENPNDHFGDAVSSAGDVNGDGYDDVIVGAINADASYIFYGGVDMDSICDVKMVGEQNRSWFGASVSSAGDVNDDGYSDVIVGACSYDADSKSNSGAAYIFYGGAPMDSIYDTKIVGEHSNDFFGSSVSSAGNVDGDDCDEVIVGADWSDGFAGSAYIFKIRSPKIDEEYAHGNNQFEGQEKLLKIFPSPTTKHTFIVFRVPAPQTPDVKQPVSIKLIDITGRVVKKLMDGEVEPGEHFLEIDTDGLKAGVFFVEIKIGGRLKEVGKLQIAK